MTDAIVFGLKQRPGSKNPWQVRWRVGGLDVSRQFPTKAAADAFRSRLLVAANSGEPFDFVTRLPRSWDRPRRNARTSWYHLTVDFMDHKWPGWSANTRKSAVETLEIACRVLVVRAVPTGIYDDLRAWLMHVALVPAGRRPKPLDERVRNDADRAAHAWLSKNSLPVGELTTERAERVLDAFAKARGSNRPTASTVVARRRTQFGGLIKFAIRRGLLTSDPLMASGWKPPLVNREIDRALVIDPVRFRTLLDVVAKTGRSGERYVAFFSVLYFAGLRPVEAIALRADDLTLPDNGWGAIAVRRGLTAPGRRFVDEGQSHEVRGLKWRAMGAVRHVPIPPELVKLLREHLDRWGAGETGLVFTNEAGQPLSRSRYARVFSAAKSRAFAKGDPLLESAPYDLRHANATLLLNAGVPIPEVARRLGHSPEILLRIYAGVMHQDEAVANERVERLLDDFTGGWFREDR